MGWGGKPSESVSAGKKGLGAEDQGLECCGRCELGDAALGVRGCTLHIEADEEVTPRKPLPIRPHWEVALKPYVCLTVWDGHVGGGIGEMIVCTVPELLGTLQAWQCVSPTGTANEKTLSFGMYPCDLWLFKNASDFSCLALEAPGRKFSRRVMEALVPASFIAYPALTWSTREPCWIIVFPLFRSVTRYEYINLKRLVCQRIWGPDSASNKPMLTVSGPIPRDDHSAIYAPGTGVLDVDNILDGEWDD